MQMTCYDLTWHKITKSQTSKSRGCSARSLPSSLEIARQGSHWFPESEHLLRCLSFKQPLQSRQSLKFSSSFPPILNTPKKSWFSRELEHLFGTRWPTRCFFRTGWDYDDATHGALNRGTLGRMVHELPNSERTLEPSLQPCPSNRDNFIGIRIEINIV